MTLRRCLGLVLAYLLLWEMAPSTNHHRYYEGPETNVPDGECHEDMPCFGVDERAQANRMTHVGRTSTMGDSENIYQACVTAQAEDREISHGTARAIASQWHDGSTVTMSFVSTGTIYVADLWQRFFGDSYDNMNQRERLAADVFGTYLLDRVKHNDAGPIEGWADKWIGDG